MYSKKLEPEKFKFSNPSDPSAKKQKVKGQIPAQESEPRGQMPLFADGSYTPRTTSKGYYLHDNYGSDPGYFGFNLDVFVQRNVRRLERPPPRLPVGPRNITKGNPAPQPESERVRKVLSTPSLTIHLLYRDRLTTQVVSLFLQGVGSLKLVGKGMSGAHAPNKQGTISVS